MSDSASDLGWWTTPSMITVALFIWLSSMSNGFDPSQGGAWIVGFAVMGLFAAFLAAGVCKVLGNAVLSLTGRGGADDDASAGA